MSVIEYIILSIALTIPTLVVVRYSVHKLPIRLVRGLGVSFLLGAEQVILLLLGIVLGNILRFDLSEYDDLVYLGLLVFVALRMFLEAMGLERKKKKGQRSIFNLSKWSTSLLLGVATGVNVLLAGLGLGFRVAIERDLWCAAISLFVIAFIFCYLGIMMGRQKKAMREKRWMLMGVIFLLAFALKVAVFGE